MVTSIRHRGHVRSAERNRHSLLTGGNLLIVQERERLLCRILREHGYDSLETVCAFEAGAGGGYNLRQLVQWGARPENLSAVDINPASIDRLRTSSPGIRAAVANASSVSEPDESFDLSLAFTLFSSVHSEADSADIAKELVRVTRPGGLVLVYDMRRNNPKNPNVHAVTQRDIERWFPGCAIRRHTLTLAPPIARSVCSKAPWLYGPLDAIPPLRTHALYVVRRPQ